MIQGLGQGLRIHPSSESQFRAAGRDTQNSLPGGGPAFQKGKSINPLVYFRPSAFVYAANARQAHRAKAHTYLWMMYTEKRHENVCRRSNTIRRSEEHETVYGHNSGESHSIGRRRCKGISPVNPESLRQKDRAGTWVTPAMHGCIHTYNRQPQTLHTPSA